MEIILFNVADYLRPNTQSSALGPAYLKAYFDKYSSYSDKININIESTDILSILKNKKPGIIGISVATEYYSEAIKLAGQLRKELPESILIIGGYHITNMPQTFNRAFDFGVIGEGEKTFLEIVHHIFSKNNTVNLKTIPGIVFFDKSGNLVFNAPRELIPDLDSIPFPFRKKNSIKLYTHIITSRGCPFSCAFCASSAFWKKTIRYNSAAYVVREMIDLIEQHKVKHITIWDDLFIGDVPRLKEISRLIKASKVFKHITFGVSARANLIAQNKEILDIFKEINVIRVSVGFESGSDRILKKLKGQSASLEKNREALELLKKYCFLVGGGFIIGSPGETIEDIKQTYDFIIKSGLDEGYAGLAVPYPNTEFWAYAERRGIVGNDIDFGKLKLTNDFKSLKNEDFILLSENAARKEVIEYGRKIQDYFVRAQLRSYFSLKMLNPNILRLFFSDPLALLPIINSLFISFFSNLKLFGSLEANKQ